MTISLFLKRFVFSRAQILLLKRGEHEGVSLEGYCHENLVTVLDVTEPAVYDMWMSHMEVRVPPSTEVIRIAGPLQPWVVDITQDDITRDRATLVMPEGGIFRMTALDSQHVAVPHHKLLVGAREITTEIQFDVDGTKLVYGNPTECFLLIEQGFAIVIEHLDPATYIK